MAASKVRQLHDSVRRADEELEALQARKAELLPQSDASCLIAPDMRSQRRNASVLGGNMTHEISCVADFNGDRNLRRSLRIVFEIGRGAPASSVSQAQN